MFASVFVSAFVVLPWSRTFRAPRHVCINMFLFRLCCVLRLVLVYLCVVASALGKPQEADLCFQSGLRREVGSETALPIPEVVSLSFLV